MNLHFDFRSFHIKGMILIITLVITIILAFCYVTFNNTDSASSITIVEEPFLICLKGELNHELFNKIENQAKEDNYLFLEINSKTELNRLIKKYDLKEYRYGSLQNIDKSFFKNNKIFAILSQGVDIDSDTKLVRIEQQKDKILMEISEKGSNFATVSADFTLICMSRDFAGERKILNISYRVDDILRPSHLYFSEEG